MAGVDVGSPSGGKRATNSDINMIPFIDFLMVTIAFLLITAVWTTQSRISADTQAPSRTDEVVDPPKQEKVLHVHVAEGEFGLAWKLAGAVVSEVRVPRAEAAAGELGARYPELAKTIAKEWAAQGSHVDPSDRGQDRAVVHTDDRVPFKEIVAVLDALAATKRDLKLRDGSTARVPAFAATFASR